MFCQIIISPNYNAFLISLKLFEESSYSFRQCLYQTVPEESKWIKKKPLTILPKFLLRSFKWYHSGFFMSVFLPQNTIENHFEQLCPTMELESCYMFFFCFPVARSLIYRSWIASILCRSLLITNSCWIIALKDQDWTTLIGKNIWGYEDIYYPNKQIRENGHIQTQHAKVKLVFLV